MRGKKVIAVVSPVAAGKTFIAVNLAATAARYNDTALLDLDFKERAVHTWMNLPAGYRALDMLVSGESTEPITVSGIKVYTNDLSANGGLKPVGVDFIDRIEAEMVIIDMPREIRMLHKKVLAKCSLVVCTGDPDYHHLLKLREVIDRDPFLIINKYGRLQAPLDFKELFGVEPEKLPLFEGVYDSILTGEPLVCFDGKAEKLFAKLYQKIMLRIT